MGGALGCYVDLGAVPCTVDAGIGCWRRRGADGGLDEIVRTGSTYEASLGAGVLRARGFEPCSDALVAEVSGWHACN